MVAPQHSTTVHIAVVDCCYYQFAQAILPCMLHNFAYQCSLMKYPQSALRGGVGRTPLLITCMAPPQLTVVLFHASAQSFTLSASGITRCASSPDLLRQLTQPIASLLDSCRHSHSRQYEPHCLLVTGSGYTLSIASTLPIEHIASICGASACTSGHLQGDTPMSIWHVDSTFQQLHRLSCFAQRVM